MKKMADKYIKASDCEKYFYEHLDDNGMIGAMNAIDEMPAADVQPVKRGRWIWKERHRNSYQIVKGIDECGKEGSLQIHEEYKEQINYCSECGKQGHEIFLNFCPNCGAVMNE